MSNNLKLEYKILSEISDYFPKNSSHKAARAIDARMQKILDELEHGDTGEVIPIKVYNPYPKVLLEEGYPTQEALDYLQNWWFGYKDGELYQGEFCEPSKNNILALTIYLKKLWNFGDWGFVLDESGKKLELHTGGWSGNEEIIPYLEMTWFHKLYWASSRKGGHYYYDWK
jgi:hypothetical protein